MFLKSGGDGLQFPCALPFFIANLRLQMAEHAHSSGSSGTHNFNKFNILNGSIALNPRGIVEGLKGPFVLLL